MIDDNIMNNIFNSAASETAVEPNLVPSHHHQNQQHSKNLSQFIYLEAGEGVDEEVEDYFSGTSSSLSLDIMSAEDNNNEEFNNYNNFNDFDNNNNQNQRLLQPTPTTTNDDIGHETCLSSSSSPKDDFQFQQPKKLNHPQPRSSHHQIKRNKLPSKRQHRLSTSISAEEVKQSIRQAQKNLPLVPKNSGLTQSEFKLQRTQLMTIIVKYVATKIMNSFPPDEKRGSNSNELPLDKFLLLITSRLKLTLTLFIKGIIYLFRYMDIIYLLRYLNQTNNFVQYNDMGFELKKLLVGCFKITIIKENRILPKHKRINLNWELITGLSNNEIIAIVKKIVSRMNGKLNIKPVEVMRMKNEMLRFVKMVTTNEN
ncbi:unnamed protein product [Candida verbasci]|uniref:Uncharacterized protein n=1 Tax=Candida verbasci TaxID=1227364 RepID=A0A9W4XG26_9ASCO|nr:unnamed protein product [Candida verbasci]